MCFGDREEVTRAESMLGCGNGRAGGGAAKALWAEKGKPGMTAAETAKNAIHKNPFEIRI